jgi:endonuclease/exonuclease/phosphatase family metal-dependent hydrolase
LKRFRGIAGSTALFAAACVGTPPPAIAPEAGHCRQGEAVQWRVPAGGDQAALRPWCEAVGPPVVYVREKDDSAGVPVDSFLVVSWNMAAGGGRMPQFVSDLRAGRLTGGDSIRNFVLLLQESRRESSDIPDFDAAQMGTASLIEDPVPPGQRVSIDVWVKDQEDLSLFYVPSMRNGVQNSAGGKEDRGNAIVSTLPLSNFLAFELPVVRQRRAVAVAHAKGRNSAGKEWDVQLTDVHFENQTEGGQNPERARLNQTNWLLSAIPDAKNAILGGDVNTWLRGPDEAAVVEITRRYPDTPRHPAGPTYERARGVIQQQLDYLFFRLPDGRAARYRRVEDLYGSDHRPMMAWVIMNR